MSLAWGMRTSTMMCCTTVLESPPMSASLSLLPTDFGLERTSLLTIRSIFLGSAPRSSRLELLGKSGRSMTLYSENGKPKALAGLVGLMSLFGGLGKDGVDRGGDFVDLGIGVLARGVRSHHSDGNAGNGNSHLVVSLLDVNIVRNDAVDDVCDTGTNNERYGFLDDVDLLHGSPFSGVSL